MTYRQLPVPPYSVAEAAHVLGVSTDTVRLMIHDGRLKGAYRAGAKLFRIPVASVDAYIERQSLTA